MCCNNPELAPAHNTGKCFAVVMLVLGILSCIGFFGGSILGGIGGIVAIVAGSMPLCCLKPSNTKCIFTASFVLTLILFIMDIVSMAMIGRALGFVNYEVTNAVCEACIAGGATREQCEAVGACSGSISLTPFINVIIWVVLIIAIVSFVLHGTCLAFFYKVRAIFNALPLSFLSPAFLHPSSSSSSFVPLPAHAHRMTLSPGSAG